MEKEESALLAGAKETEDEQNGSHEKKSNNVITNQPFGISVADNVQTFALGSRASSPSSHYREPLVQIMNDSEFSSPGRGASSMQDLEKQEEAKEREENAAM